MDNPALCVCSLQRSVSVRGLRVAQDAKDLASCGRQRCLYVADSGRQVIHRVLSDGNATVWPLKDKPSALSVTRLAGSERPQSAGNLLVTFSVSRTLREYSPDGRLLHQVCLDLQPGTAAASPRGTSSDHTSSPPYACPGSKFSPDSDSEIILKIGSYLMKLRRTKTIVPFILGHPVEALGT